MIWIGRVVILVAWTGMAVVLFGVLMFVFTFGDCRSDDFACRQHQIAAGQTVTILVSILYGIGVGAMLQRWLLDRKRS